MSKLNFDEVKQMADEGYGKKEIAQKFGCHEETVRRFCKKHNIQTHGYFTKDLTGKRNGKITFIIATTKKSEDKHIIWECECDCGNKLFLPSNSQVTHCKECENNIKLFGKSNTRIYKIWVGMKNRCTNKKINSYENYGGKGIKVCEEWANNFESFYEWSIKNGYKDGLSIDRIDISKDYEPNNCRWVTMKEQQRNKSNNRILNFEGENKCLAEWAEIYNIPQDTLKARIDKYGWSVEKALLTKVRKRKDNRYE